jgi:hypothetical protein
MSGAAACCWPIHEIALSAMASVKCHFGLSCGGSMGAVFSKSGRVPLARLSSLEPVEVAEPLTRRPAIKGPGGAQLVVWCVMPFAKGSGGVVIP